MRMSIMDSEITKLALPAAAVLAVIVCGCSATTGQAVPKSIEQLIERYERGSEDASPRAIWKYSYRGADVFYVPLSVVCCDRFSELYDQAGNLICAPDGGITGAGDGNCPDFVPQPSVGVRIWSDPRLR
jgi:Domain of unknown function (DUF6970)